MGSVYTKLNDLRFVGPEYFNEKSVQPYRMSRLIQRRPKCLEKRREAMNSESRKKTFD